MVSIHPMANVALIYDKHAVIQKLEKRGFSHDQAEGIAEVLTEPDASQLATKLDLEVLKTDFEKALHRQTWGLIGVIFAQAAFIIAVLQLLD
jgi:hypothetical protein